MSEYTPVGYELTAVDTKNNLLYAVSGRYAFEIEQGTVFHHKMRERDWALWEIYSNTRKALKDE